MKFWKRLHIYSSHLFLVVADTSLATSHCNAAEPGVEMETAQLSGCVLINEKEPGPTHFQRFSRNLLLSPENQPHMDKVFLPSFLPSFKEKPGMACMSICIEFKLIMFCRINQYRIIYNPCRSQKAFKVDLFPLCLDPLTIF